MSKTKNMAPKKRKAGTRAAIGLTPGKTETKSDEQLAGDLCDRIAEGMSLREAGESSGLEPTKFLRMLSKEDDDGPLVRQYVRARASRADARFEKVDEIMALLRAGRIDPNSARVMLDAIKWQSGKENAKRYGDKLDLTTNGKDIPPVQGMLIGTKDAPEV